MRPLLGHRPHEPRAHHREVHRLQRHGEGLTAMANRTCPDCGGFGQARTRNAVVSCPACHGTGIDPTP